MKLGMLNHMKKSLKELYEKLHRPINKGASAVSHRGPKAKPDGIKHTVAHTNVLCMH